MKNLNLVFLAIDKVVFAVKTDEYDRTNDEKLYNEACNCSLDEEVASMYYYGDMFLNTLIFFCSYSD